MTDSVAKLDIIFGAPNAKETAADLDKVAAAATKTEEAVKKVGPSAKKSSDDLGGMSGAMKLLVGDAGGAVSEIESLIANFSKFAGVGGAVLGVIGAISVAMAALVVNTVRLNDQIGDMADELGKTTEEMDRLRKVARESGASMDDVVAVTVKLQRNLGAAQKETSKQAEALRALGLNASASEDDVVKALAAMDSGLNKNVLMMELLGKSGTKYNELIGDMARNHEHVGTTSAQASIEADRLGRAWNNMIGTMADWGRSAAEPVIHYLDIMITKFQSLGVYVKDFKWNDLSTWDPNTAANKAVEMKAVIDKALASSSSKDYDARDLARNNGSLLQSGLADEAKRQAELMKEAAAAAKKLQDELDALDKKWSDIIAGEVLQWDPKTIKGIEELDRLYKAGKKSLDEYNIGVDKLLTTDSIRLKEQREINKEIVEYNKVLGDSISHEQNKIDNMIRMVEASKENNEKIKQETGAIGLSSTALIEYNAELERTRILKLEITDGAKTNLLGLLEERTQLLKNKEAVQQYSDTWKTVAQNLTQSATNFIVDFVNNGSSAFKNLWNNFKKWALEALAQIAAKQIVLGIAGAVGGSSAANATGLGGGSGGIGNLVSGASSLSGMFGGPTIGSSLFGGVGSAISAGYASGAAGFTGVASAGVIEAGSVAGGVMSGAGGVGAGIMGGLEAGLAAVPVVGWVALAGLVVYGIYSALAQKKGGPKDGGFGSAGDIANIARWGETPTSMDGTLNTAAGGLLTSYQGALKSLGGSGTGGGFAMKLDTDPKGTAGDQGAVASYVNGQEVYKYANGNMGRDSTANQATMTLEGKRAILAALQASGLSDDITRILKITDAHDASSDFIDQLLAFAGAMKSVDEVMTGNPIADAMSAIAKESGTLQGGLTNNATALLQMGKDFDGTTASSTALASATQQYYNNVVQVIGAMEKLKGTISDMFAASEAAWLKDTQTTQERYNSDQKEIDRLREEIRTTASADVINRDTSQINSLMNEAWGLLSPEQKATQLQAFIDGAEQINTLATERLTDMQTTASDEMTNVVTQIHDAMMAVADKMTTAANVIANTRIGVDVTVHSDGSASAEVNVGDGGSGGG